MKLLCMHGHLQSRLFSIKRHQYHGVQELQEDPSLTHLLGWNANKLSTIFIKCVVLKTKVKYQQ